MSGSNFSLTTFSSSGKLVQIEHALTAVGNGRASLGIAASNGVCIATEKVLPSPLIDPASVRKIENLTDHIGVVYSGMSPDYRLLVRKARKAAQRYWLTYHEHIPVQMMVREVATVMQEYTQRGGVRPFGVSLLIAGCDEAGGPQLYQVDPSGSYWAWKASAIGRNATNSKTFLEKRYLIGTPELEDAVQIGLLTLKESFEGAMTEHNIEVGLIDQKSGKFRVLKPSEVKDYLDEVE